MRIADRSLGSGEAIMVVAEIGNNHDGNIGQAKALIAAAAEAGADAVKFQTHIADAEMLPSTPSPPHFAEPRFDFTKRMELSLSDHLELKRCAGDHGLVFFSSPFSVEAVRLLQRVDIPVYKIASGEVTNPLLVEAVAATGRPVFLSTGMSGIEDLEAPVATLRAAAADFVVLHCTSSYPCPPELVNLRALTTLGVTFNCPVGLSDHTPDIYTSLAAVVFGAVCIEKHFTLSRRLYGPDHHASLEPSDFARLVSGIRQVEAALGTGDKRRLAAHDPVRATFEKSIVTRTPVEQGAVIESSMLTTKRPGTGIPAARLADIVGRRAARPLQENRLLEETDIG